MLIPVTSIDEISTCATLIRRAFETVASDFHLNSENCPSHPSLISNQKLTEMFNKGVSMFTWNEEEKPVGLVKD